MDRRAGWLTGLGWTELDWTGLGWVFLKDRRAGLGFWKGKRVDGGEKREGLQSRLSDHRRQNGRGGVMESGVEWSGGEGSGESRKWSGGEESNE